MRSNNDSVVLSQNLIADFLKKVAENPLPKKRWLEPLFLSATSTVLVDCQYLWTLLSPYWIETSFLQSQSPKSPPGLDEFLLVIDFFPNKFGPSTRKNFLPFDQ